MAAAVPDSRGGSSAASAQVGAATAERPPRLIRLQIGGNNRTRCSHYFHSAQEHHYQSVFWTIFNNNQKPLILQRIVSLCPPRLPCCCWQQVMWGKHIRPPLFRSHKPCSVITNESCSSNIMKFQVQDQRPHPISPHKYFSTAYPILPAYIISALLLPYYLWFILNPHLYDLC